MNLLKGEGKLGRWPSIYNIIVPAIPGEVKRGQKDLIQGHLCNHPYISTHPDNDHCQQSLQPTTRLARTSMGPYARLYKRGWWGHSMTTSSPCSGLLKVGPVVITVDPCMFLFKVLTFEQVSPVHGPWEGVFPSHGSTGKILHTCSLSSLLPFSLVHLQTTPTSILRVLPALELLNAA